MFKLTSAGNVIVPAYLTLLHKGYMVRQEVKDESEIWFAETEDRLFTAEDVLSLLGLVAIYEGRGEEWRADDEAITRFIAQYYPGQ
jgi:hypothetical protein